MKKGKFAITMVFGLAAAVVMSMSGSVLAENGSDFHMKQPPSRFNPLTATASELAVYGFPQKPTNPHELEGWSYAMKHAKQWVKPVQKSVSAVSWSADHAIWAGYVAPANTNLYNGVTPKFTEVSCDFTIPTYYGSGEPAYWAGIGGYNTASGDLVQAGVLANTPPFSPDITTVNSFTRIIIYHQIL